MQDYSHMIIILMRGKCNANYIKYNAQIVTPEGEVEQLNGKLDRGVRRQRKNKTF